MRHHFRTDQGRTIGHGVPRRMPRVVPGLVLILAVAFLVLPAATGAAGSPTPSDPPNLRPVLASTQLWVGENDILVDLLDADWTRFEDPVANASVDLVGPDGLARGPLPLDRIRLASTGRDLYRGRVVLDTPGPWVANVSALTTAGQRLDGATPFEVRDDAGTPGLGQPAPSVRTPTIATATIGSITSDPDPVPQLYWRSLDEAMRAGRPILYVIDTARPGVADACGSAMGEARIMRGNFPGLTVIHAEPFVFGDDDAVVTGPGQEPARIAPWAAAWGVTEPPWMFVITPDGTVSAKFQGIFGTDELLSALRRVAPYAPGSH